MKKLFVSLLAIFMVLFLASCDPSSSAPTFEGTSEGATAQYKEAVAYLSLLGNGPYQTGTNSYIFSEFDTNEDLKNAIISIIHTYNLIDDDQANSGDIVITEASGTLTATFKSDTNFSREYSDVQISYTYKGEARTLSISGEYVMSQSGYSINLTISNLVINGMEYYEKAFYGSIDINDPVITLSAFSSLASEALENKTLQQYDAMLSTFKKLKIPDNTQNKAYYYQFLLALEAIRQADFPTAWQAFDRMEALTDTTKTLEKRFHVFTLLNKNLCYEMTGEYDSAIQTALKIEKIIPPSDPGLYDFAMANFFSLSDYYNRKGDENISLHYLKKGLAISDSILNFKKLSQIHEMKTNYEIGKMNDHIRDVEHKRQIQLVILYMVLAILGMIAAFLTWVIRQNQALRQKNQDLFAKNEALLRQEEFFKEFRRQNAGNRTPCNEQITGNQSIEKNIHNPEKYMGSSLGSHQKADISNRIRNVMEQNPTIYSSDFSLEKLADLVDCNPKYVSQVINELLGKNFNAFVAEYRVKEACRRITDTEHYGHLT